MNKDFCEKTRWGLALYVENGGKGRCDAVSGEELEGRGVRL